MTFPVVGSNVPLPYEISNSLRFNRSDSPYLSRTPASAGNRKTWTWSGWVKRSKIDVDGNIFLAQSGNTYTYISFNSSNQINIGSATSGTTNHNQVTASVFRDPSAWYHIVFAFDTTQATASNRIKLWVNGNLQTVTISTQIAQNTDGHINNTIFHSIGSNATPASFFDGYQTEVNFIDGQALTPSNFGESDLDSGIWKPKQYEGTYGTNGFYLKFANSGNMGEDSSGNDNTWTPTNLSGTTDVTTDTPTNNFATLNSTLGSGLTLSEGNTQVTVGATIPRAAASTFSLNTGKWYCEVKITAVTAGATFIGVEADNFSQNSTVYSNADGVYYFNDGNKYVDATQTSYGASYTTNDIIGIALNLDDDEITFYKNGASQGTITTKTFDGGYYFIGTHGSGSNSSGYNFNFGNPSFSITSGNTDDNGYGNFEYAPPTGYLSLCSANLATALSPTIDDGSQYFNTLLWTGNGTSSSRSLTGVGFQPDWTWIKPRQGNPNATHHQLYDSNRGTGKSLRSSGTEAEITNSAYGYLSSFDSDGFSSVAGSNNNENINETGATFVAWNWKANSGTTSSNTDGDITSTVQVNATSGFSIVQFTKTGDDQAVGHGLGKKPKLIIIKPTTTAATNWIVMPEIGGVMSNKYLVLNSADSLGTDGSYAEPTSSVFYVSNQVAGNNTHIGYVFTDIEGYSKFGSYTGNGNTNGAFIYTGFRPAFVIIKRTDAAGFSWGIYDNKRPEYNLVDRYLMANQTLAEQSGNNQLDLVSNGFKMKSSNGGTNTLNATYIYMAFAENPFVTSGAVPVTAR